MGKLEGKVALVTGSGRNIGRATVLKLAAEGANVIVNSRSNHQEADAVADEARALGVKALALIADVAKKVEVDRMLSRAMSEFGRVDILINNAAIRPHKAFTELTLEDWEEVRGVVLDGAFYCTRGVIESMVKHQYGRILFFTGEGAFQGAANRGRRPASTGARSTCCPICWAAGRSWPTTSPSTSRPGCGGSRKRSATTPTSGIRSNTGSSSRW